MAADIVARALASQAKTVSNQATSDVADLESQVQSIVAEAVNTAIGIYSITPSGTNTLTGSFTDLTLFTGLKISLKIANANTGAVTFNLNSLGAKAIVRVDSAGTKVALTANDLTPSKIAIIEYDGTDFIWVNSVDGNASYTTSTTSQSNVLSFPSTALKGQFDAELRGFTAVNLLGSAGDCESLTGWTGKDSSTIALDSSNKVFGSNSIKYTHGANNNGGLLRNITTLVNSDKYYMISVYLKTDGTSSSGGSLRLYDNAYALISSSSYYKGTSWQRLCIKVQPSDFSGKDLTVIRAGINDLDTNQTAIGYVDGFMINEITQTEYDSLSTDQLMAKYNYVNTYKSVDSQRITCTGKNLFNAFQTPYFASTNTSYSITQDGTVNAYNTISGTFQFVAYRITLKPNTTYRMTRILTKVTAGTDTINGKIYIRPMTALTEGNPILTIDNTVGSASGSFTTTQDISYRVSFMVTGSVSELASMQFSSIQIEEGSSATTYEAYKETTSYLPVMLSAVSDTAYDIFDPNTGLHTKNIINWVTLSGNNFVWGISNDSTGYKTIYATDAAINGIFSSDKLLVYKYDLKKLTSNYPTLSAGDMCALSSTIGRVLITASDTDSGWIDEWTNGTSFTGMTWSGIIKGYMNGWKLTTPDLNVANCIWTGIASGTTQSGSGGYTTVTTTLDAGFTPYRMIYQLATPVKTYYPAAAMLAEPKGNFVVESAIQDVSVYQNTKITIANTSYPCKTLLYVNKINIQTGELTAIALNNITIASDGLTFTITGAVNGEYYDYGYSYESSLSTIPVTSYSYPTNIKAQVENNSRMISNIDVEIKALQNINDANTTPFASYTPTLVWTTGTPAAITTMSNFRVINKLCYFNINISSADGNGATALTVTLPFSRITNGSTIIANAQQKVNTTWSNPLAYIADGDNKVQFRNLSTCTDNVACEVNINGWYQIA